MFLAPMHVPKKQQQNLISTPLNALVFKINCNSYKQWREREEKIHQKFQILLVWVIINIKFPN